MVPRPMDVYVPDGGHRAVFSVLLIRCFHLSSFLLLLPARLTGTHTHSRGACQGQDFVVTYRCWLVSLSSFFFFFPFFFFFFFFFFPILTLSVFTIALKGNVGVYIVRFHFILLSSFSSCSTTSVIAIRRLLSVGGCHRRHRHRDLVPTILLQLLLLRR